MRDDDDAIKSGARVDDDPVEAKASQYPSIFVGTAAQLASPSTRNGTGRTSVRVSEAEASENADGANADANAEADAIDADAIDADADDAELGTLHHDMQCYLAQINAIPTHVAAESEDDQSDGAHVDALLGVRVWSERPEKKRGGPTADCESNSIFVPMHVSVDEGELFRVIPFRSGVYRGQVVEEARVGDDIPSQVDADVKDPAPIHDDLLLVSIPHGFGVWTSADGSCRCGQWTRGEQTGVGTQQHRGVLMYEGEWRHDCPTGVGVGIFADGSSFVGEWVNGRPYGLGSLRAVEERATITATTGERICFGWFFGTQCLQPCSRSVVDNGSDADDDGNKVSNSITRTARVAVPSKFEDQPLRGLYIASMRLEAWRVGKFQQVIDRWRFVCCHQAIESAHRSRQLAMIAWQKAHAAQQKADDEHILESTEQRKRDDSGLVQLALKSREKHARVLRVREYHEQRRVTAEFQCELARCCVNTQQDTVSLMESELSTIVKLLLEAKQAQAECSQYSHQLQLIKRQIENVSLKINDVRLRQERGRLNSTKSTQSGQTPSRPSSTISSLPGTPISTGFVKHSSRGTLQAEPVNMVRFVGDQKESNIALVNPDYVCDVPGCGCGIPRDVFMRVGAALNGES